MNPSKIVPRFGAEMTQISQNTPNAIAMLPHAKPLRATPLVAACKQCCQTEQNSAAHSEI
jgi:hypothetical protein